MSKRIISYLIIGGLVAIFVYTLLQSSNTGEDPQAYTQRMVQERAEKDASFRSAEDSPIPENQRSSFKGLSYYAVQPDYKIMARLEQNPREEYMQIQTTTGESEGYKRWGWAHFQLDGRNLKLLILQPVNDKDYLFIPFADETSARETYGAGRYLEVEAPESGNRIVLDFNQAYNPYCAYNEKYSCPLPPAENLLPLAIAAGEKTYEK